MAPSVPPLHRQVGLSDQQVLELVTPLLVEQRRHLKRVPTLPPPFPPRKESAPPRHPLELQATPFLALVLRLWSELRGTQQALTVTSSSTRVTSSCALRSTP